MKKILLSLAICAIGCFAMTDSMQAQSSQEIENIQTLIQKYEKAGMTTEANMYKQKLAQAQKATPTRTNVQKKSGFVTSQNQPIGGVITPMVQTQRTQPQPISLDLTREVTVAEVQQMGYDQLLELLPVQQRNELLNSFNGQSTSFQESVLDRLQTIIINYLQNK